MCRLQGPAPKFLMQVWVKQEPSQLVLLLWGGSSQAQVRPWWEKADATGRHGLASQTPLCGQPLLHLGQAGGSRAVRTWEAEHRQSLSLNAGYAQHGACTGVLTTSSFFYLARLGKEWLLFPFPGRKI